MKKTCSYLLAAVMVFSLSACGNSGNSASTGSNENAARESQAVPQTSDVGVQVEEGLLNVTITLPATYFENQENFDPDTYTKEHGLKKTVKNEDGSISITMSKSKHDELMGEIKTAVDETLQELIEAEDTPYIKAVTSSEGFGVVTVDVDKAGYESAFDMTPLLIGFSSMMYQQYDGAELHCEVIIRDIDTGETLNSAVYPDVTN